MSTYAIGDIQGCFKPFMQLLETLSFNPKTDTLWLTGDLINRGPESLETLRFLKSLSDQVSYSTQIKTLITVLGNHDLTLLAVAYDAIPYQSKHHTFQDILDAPDKIDLIEWLRHQPLVHHDPILNYTMVHAGLHPKWDIKLSLSLAKEVQSVLQSNSSTLIPFLKNMYGNKPTHWDPTLSGFERLRFITNCFTRMRFCDMNGNLDLVTKESSHKNPSGFLPWFEVPNRANEDLNIVFGHWAALEGKANVKNVFPLDTGCVWGGCLTALRLEDGAFFEVNCIKN